MIVGITPGTTQLKLAYAAAQRLLLKGEHTEEILREVKKAGGFGGSSMRPNLLKMLRHFHFEHILSIDNVESLWGRNAQLLHSTSVLPHAAFKKGKMFAGSFDEVLTSPVVRACFEDCFVSSLTELPSDALYLGLGPCPSGALSWCVQNGHLDQDQVLGAFCHPSTSGGSKTRYYLREVTREQLNPKDPTRRQCDWLDSAYTQMSRATRLHGGGPLSRNTA